MTITILFLLVFCTGASAIDSLYLNATVDNSLNIHVFVRKITEAKVTGFNIYFTSNEGQTNDEFKEWKHQEILANSNSYSMILDAKKYSIKENTIYRIRATVFLNNVESGPSSTVTINTKNAAPKAPVIHATKVLHNSSVLISFIPAENLKQNYTIQYKKEAEDVWKSLNFQPDTDGTVLLSGLEANETYLLQMFVHGSALPGEVSNTVNFTTNTTALATVRLEPSGEWFLDPTTSDPLDVKCTVKTSTPAQISWLINREVVSKDSSFYTIATTVHEEFIESTIRAKSRTRSALFTCVATNAAGDSSDVLNVTIRGPGSAPSQITLVAERQGYTISWEPPSHPNGEITKYVVYHTLNREDPLSDWKKIDLDGRERFIRVIADTEDSFYGRVQAATDLGPGIISDIVAMERDTQPISVDMELLGEEAEQKANQIVVVDPRKTLTVQCVSRGKPRPSLSFAVSDRANAIEVEVDIWQREQSTSSGGVVTAIHNFSVLTSKFVHCGARNSAGANYSTIELRVDKPGDAPSNIQVLSINSVDAVVVWAPPVFPNLPITKCTVLIGKDKEEDKGLWARFETNEKEVRLNRMSLPTRDLEKSTEYYAGIRCENVAGEGPLSDIVSFVTPNGGPDSAPEDVKAEINEANQVVISWKTPPSTSSLSGYSLYYTRDLSLSNSDYKDWQVINLPADYYWFKFDHAVGLKPKTFYRMRIAGKNENAVGPPSSTVEFETAYSELPIPTDVRTKVEEDNTLHVLFTAVRDPDDHTKAIQNYRVELSASDDILTASWLTMKPARIDLDELKSTIDVKVDGDRLEKNKMYWVKVTAVLANPTRLVQASKPRSFRTHHGRMMTTVRVEGGEDTLQVDPDLKTPWTVTCVGEGSPPPLLMWKWNGLQIVNGTEGWTFHETPGEKTTSSKLRKSSSVESGTVLCEAFNSEGNASKAIEVKVLGPGDSPTSVRLEPYRNQINISWASPKLPNGEIMKYIIYHSMSATDDLSDWAKFETTELEAFIDCDQPSTKYFVRLQAVNEHGPGIISDVLDCTSDQLYEPLEIEIFADNIVDFEAEPTQNVHLRCSGRGHPTPSISYRYNETWQQILELTVEDGFEVSLPTVSTRTNLTVFCMARNKHEEVVVNRTIVVRRPGESPQNITWRFEASEEEDALLIDWMPVRYPNTETGIEYNLYLSNFKTKVSGPPVRIPDLPLNVKVILRISGENEFGEGEKSPSIVIPTPTGGPKTPPILTSLHAENEKAHIQWTAPVRPNGNITGYSIHVKAVDDLDWKTISVSGNETSVKLGEEVGLEKGRSYQIKMSARNEKSEGVESHVYDFDLISSKQLPVVENATSFVDNGTIWVNVSTVPFEKLVVYLTDDTNHWKFELDVPSEDTLISLPYQAEPGVSYKLRLSGVKASHEGPTSAPIEVEKARSEEVATSSGQDRRNLIKEPPL